MTILLLSIWTSVVLFATLVNRKFKWTLPNYGALCLFFGFGVLSTLGAVLFTSWVMRETPLHVESPDLWNRLLAFFVAAGMGEEFFKMGACLIAVSIMILMRSQLRSGVVVLGCVCVALTFACIENTMYHLGGVDAMGILKRSYLAVPLHACMGFIHGICIDRSLRRGSIIPLFFGYFVTVALHTLYDVMDSILALALHAAGMGEAIPHLDVPAELMYGPVVIPLVLWMALRWHKVDELETMTLTKE